MSSHVQKNERTNRIWRLLEMGLGREGAPTVYHANNFELESGAAGN